MTVQPEHWPVLAPPGFVYPPTPPPAPVRAAAARTGAGHLRDKSKARGRLRRRSVPIMAYIGPNGGGKSLAAVYDCIPSLQFGRPVLSTVRLLDFDNPRGCEGCDEPGHDSGHMQSHPLYVPLRDFRQLLSWTDGDVLMDEVTGIASSRESAGMPVQVANYLPQLRRRNVVLRWTAPAWARADKIIREVSQGVTLCMGFLGKNRPTPEGEAPRLWSDRRLFSWRTYDATAFDEFTRNASKSMRASAKQWFWRPGSLAESAYDTLDAVLSLGSASEAGLCMVCGGRRTAPKCSCEGQHGSGGRGRGPRQREHHGPAPDGLPPDNVADIFGPSSAWPRKRR